MSKLETTTGIPEAGEEQVCVPGHRAGHADIVRVPAGQHAVAQQTVHMNRYNAVTAKILFDQTLSYQYTKYIAIPSYQCKPRITWLIPAYAPGGAWRELKGREEPGSTGKRGQPWVTFTCIL